MDLPKVTQGVKGRTRPCPRPRVPQILLLFTPRGLTMGDFERLQKGLEESLRDPPAVAAGWTGRTSPAGKVQPRSFLWEITELIPRLRFICFR